MQTDGVPPTIVLIQKLTGTWVAQCISVAAKLGTADALAEGPKGAEELAAAANAHAPSLYRVLRALASVGIFAEDEDGRFRLTALAEPLCSDVQGSVRSFAIMMGEPWNYRPWEHLIHSVTTGQTGFQHAFGTGIWEYLADQPEASALFDAAMTGRSGPDDAAVVTDYDFSGLKVVVDVAGGRGSLLAAILCANPDMWGILFDQLLVVETVIPPGNEPSFGKLLDVHMLVWTGGKERTEAEYRALFSAAGFELSKVVPTRSSLSVVEGVPR